MRKQPTNQKILDFFSRMEKKCGLPEYTQTCTARLSIEINNGAGFLSLSLSLSRSVSRARSLSLCIDAEFSWRLKYVWPEK